MKLYLDDWREPENDEWTLATTSAEAIAHLETGEVTEVSLDYALNMTDGFKTGADVARELVRLVKAGKIERPVIFIHSGLPEGVREIERVIAVLDK